jgi:hypothetical protein
MPFGPQWEAPPPESQGTGGNRTWWDKVKSAPGKLVGGMAASRGDNEFRQVDPEGNLATQGGLASQLADRGTTGYGQSMGHLGRIMRGEESLSGEQLRQGLQQNVAGQQAMAAGARPGNAAMAARTAQNNAAMMGAGLAGQQATAGIQERQGAASQLGNLGLQGALGGRGQAIDAFGRIEEQRGNRFGAMAQVPTAGERGTGLLAGALGALGALSDMRAKTDVEDGSAGVRRMLHSLEPASYRYRDPARHGEGQHVGIMAQDLERTPEGQSMVVETPEGKGIDGGKLAGALAAATADMNRRLEEIERKRRADAQQQPQQEQRGGLLSMLGM